MCTCGVLCLDDWLVLKVVCNNVTSFSPLCLALTLALSLFFCLSLAQTSSVQDTPELLGFLRNSSSPHRYRRATSAAQPYSSKTLVLTIRALHYQQPWISLSACLVLLYSSSFGMYMNSLSRSLPLYRTAVTSFV